MIHLQPLPANNTLFVGGMVLLFHCITTIAIISLLLMNSSSGDIYTPLLHKILILDGVFIMLHLIYRNYLSYMRKEIQTKLSLSQKYILIIHSTHSRWLTALLRANSFGLHLVQSSIEDVNGSGEKRNWIISDGHFVFEGVTPPDISIAHRVKAAAKDRSQPNHCPILLQA